MAGHFSSLLLADQAATIGPQSGAKVPVTVLTGFLGSGKTTLLNRLLRQPGLDGTVVIVNEFGAIGIDHDLITHTTENTVLLANGCLCCEVRGDLVAALSDLAQHMGSQLQRVLIETSGLADPTPILRVLMGDPVVSRLFALQGVACTIDSVLGTQTLAEYPESRRQAAVADALVLTKTDLPAASQDSAGQAALMVELRRINPDAAIVTSPQDPVMALLALMQQQAHRAPVEESVAGYRPLAATPQAEAAPAQHAKGITSFVITRDTPLPLAPFAHWLDMVVASRGADLLRVKGLIHTTDDPEHPLLIHGVQHLFTPPERLPRWPSQDTRTRLVFITRGVDAQALSDTLDILVRKHGRQAMSAQPH
ncbi:GTP-binding protein [Acidovorax sp. DW039]|uniref:CobW family GTP-binding protein n=1 Tax=Acidovorax sp. DW039 TaxID=3095606 RepID=UPI00308634C4|nr:GTP-binding protein [Acidovorax sp. DW039]